MPIKYEELLEKYRNGEIPFSTLDNYGQDLAVKTLSANKGTQNDPLNYKGWSLNPERFLTWHHIREDISDMKDFFDNYVNGEGLERIRKNQTELLKKRHPILYYLFGHRANSPEVIKTDHNKYKDDKKVFILSTGSTPERSFAYNKQTAFVFNPYDKSKELAKSDNDYDKPLDFVKGHEFSHLFRSGHYPHDIQEEVLNSNTSEKTWHSGWNVEEKRADIWGLKYLLYKEGIYDSGSDKDITPEQVESLRTKYPKLRPLQQMDNEKAAWMLNHVAQNTNNPYSDPNRARV